MKLREVVEALEKIAPTASAADWDNVGLLAGDPEQEVRRALFAIDCTREVLEEAVAGEHELVVAYHPPIFEPLRQVVSGHVVYEAVRRGLAIWSPHTALDVAEGGTNDVLAEAMGIAVRYPLAKIQSKRAGEVGIGRMGRIDRTPRAALIERAKRALGVESLLVAGPTSGDAERVAVCAGSGGDFVEKAIAAGIEVYVTGEVRHHAALRAAAAGMTVIVARHSVSERLALAPYARRLDALGGIEVAVSEQDRDPLVFA